MPLSLEEIKYQHLKGSAQIILASSDGKVLASCDTLAPIPVGYDLFDTESFLQKPSLRDQLLLNEDLNMHGVRLNMGGTEAVYDLQLTHSSKGSNGAQIILFIEDRTQSVTFIEDEESEEKLREFILKISTPLDILKELSLSERGEKEVSPARGLIMAYFDRFIHGVHHSQINFPREEVPFRVEHISVAVEMCFANMMKSRGLKLTSVVSFESKFLIGDRLGILQVVFQALGYLLTEQKSGHVQVAFDYLPKQEQLEIEISGAPEPAGYKVLADRMGSEREFSIESEATLRLLFDCRVVAYKTPVFKASVTLSKNEFPYLFGITGGDFSLVKDIFQTILVSLTMDMDDLRKAMIQEDAELIGRIAHKMKPNFASLQRQDIAEALQYIEEITTGEDHTELETRLNEFMESADEALENLKKYKV
ncbi:MAG: Hpt domain-containing protein [Marinoscillum sp.]|uniref:Hpt domain-containing protein n=1 Tax=Marinoscillum sp. TaxID=2024838 RepID=UPI0033043F0F